MNACTRTVRLATLLIAVALSSVGAEAQLITLKTVPVATGDQFMIFPSANQGLGGIGIALDDPLLDSFVNPAKGARMTHSPLFGAPTIYNVSDDNGSARTLPAGVFLSGERIFGSVALAFQQYESPERQRGFGFVDDGFPQRLSERASYNRYAFASLGSRLSGSTSVAASVFGADLEAVDGVDLLYAQSEDIDQFGSMIDARIGLLHEWGDTRSLEVLLLHNRWDMTHDVSYIDVLWEPEVWEPRVTRREETNLDRTNTWGLHLGYMQPLGASDWQVGTILTANRKTHPKIPNYEIMNIPRDPGESWAYNLGVGLAREVGLARLGVEVVYEPIWSDTWAEADTAVTTTGGGTLAAGERTVDNDSRFSNALVRTGIGRESEKWGIQMGLQMRSISYRLRQHDHVLESRRRQTESWVEWTPTWGGALKFPEFQVRYVGNLITGTGRPGVDIMTPAFGAGELASDVVLAPSGPLTLQDVSVATHQLSVAVPIR